jgi:phage tail protein X
VGSFLINGGVAASVEHLQSVAFSFYGNAAGILSAIFTAPPLPITKVTPLLTNGLPGADPGDLDPLRQGSL